MTMRIVSRLRAFGRGVRDDLLSRGAKAKLEPSRRGFLTVGFGSLVGGIAPIWGPVHDLLKNMPLVDQLARSLIPLALGCICWRFARAKEMIQEPGVIVGPPRDPVAYYEFDARTRAAAWLATVAMLVLGIVSLVPLWPTCGGAQYAGYICNAQSREPVTSGTVDLRDAIGRTLGAPLPLDGDGWFSMDEQRAGLRPDALQLDADDCRTKELLRRDDATGDLDGCAIREAHDQRVRHGGPWPTWYVHCEAR